MRKLFLKVKSQNRTWFSVNWFFINRNWKTLLLKIDSVCILTINKFGNIDIDWPDIRISGQWICKTNIGLHIIYDDDIKKKVNGEQVTVGPKTSKQILGVGSFIISN
jgi:hypothetical protein